MKDVAILMACHNRASTTQKCLESVEKASTGVNWNFELFVVDDGSVDNTSEVLANSKIPTHLIKGPGDWYWARSMANAESRVPDSFDAYLWLNDDVVLYPNAFENLKKFAEKFPEAIVVGQLNDPDKPGIQFGGKKLESRFLNKMKTVESTGVEDSFISFTGNFVYIPRSASKVIGPIDGAFSHGYADFDYGLRASKLGIRVVVPPMYFGICADNSIAKKQSLGVRLHYLLADPKGNPLKSQIRFYKRHGGWKWPIYVIYPFFAALLGRNSRNETRFIGPLRRTFRR